VSALGVGSGGGSDSGSDSSSSSDSGSKNKNLASAWTADDEALRNSDLRRGDGVHMSNAIDASDNSSSHGWGANVRDTDSGIIMILKRKRREMMRNRLLVLSMAKFANTLSHDQIRMHIKRISRLYEDHFEFNFGLCIN
jgi:hypothetical protein